MKPIYGTILIYLTCCSFLAAEERQRVQIFGALGMSVLDDARFVTEKYTSGCVGFGIAFRQSSHIGFRGDVNHFSITRDHVAYPYQSKVWNFGGDLIYYFTDTNHQPYGFGGVRLLNYHQTSDAPSLPGTFETGVNSIGLDFGFGIQSFVSRNISVRPEFRLVYDTDLDEHNEAHSYIFDFTAAIAYHW